MAVLALPRHHESVDIRVGLILLLLTAVAAILPACAPADLRSPTGSVTTIVLLRHADRNPLQEDLTDEGRERAAALPKALAGMPIDAIYSLDIKRNLDTAEPLAKERGLTVKIVRESRVAEQIVRGNPGKTVVWVGNTDNLADIYSALRGEGPPPVRYGDLFIVRLPDQGPTMVTKTHYGRPPATARERAPTP